MPATQRPCCHLPRRAAPCRRAARRGSDLPVLQSALGQWGTDLDALVTLPGTVPLDWDGQVLRLTRRSSAVPDPGALVVGWTRRSVQGQNHWLRWQSPPLATRAEWQQAWQQAAQWARNPGEDARRLEVVLVGRITRDWVNPLKGGGKS